MGDERITISCGVSTFPDDGQQSYSQLVDMANQLMYKAKADGKDRIATTRMTTASNQS
jgi:PleD family two-component response regulator